MTTVAVVGTGRMGSAMARAIARGGATLVVHNRSREPGRGAGHPGRRSRGSTPAEASAAADISITMLADGDAVRAMWGGPDGLVAGARRDSVLVDMSTVPPDTLEPFAAPARERGVGDRRRPRLGQHRAGRAGQLTIMAGGSSEDLERARPALDLVAKQVTHAGPLGSGAALKLAVNAVIFALNNGVSEALVLAERAGVDRALAYEVFATSAVGAPYLGYKRAAFVDPESSPVAFSLDLAAKDLRLITELADRLGVSVPQARANRALIGDASTSLGPDRDFSAVATHLRQLANAG